MNFIKTVLAITLGVSLALMCETAAHLLVHKHREGKKEKEKKDKDKKS